MAIGECDRQVNISSGRKAYFSILIPGLVVLQTNAARLLRDLLSRSFISRRATSGFSVPRTIILLENELT